MASRLSLGFRSYRYQHPTASDAKETHVNTKDGWTPLRAVLALAEERRRTATLSADMFTSAGHHAITSRRLERSMTDFRAVLNAFRPSGLKRALRQRQTMPAVAG